MCIIYSSYIQHLTNKQRQTTEKSTVGSEAQRRWELFECKWVPMSAPQLDRRLVGPAPAVSSRVSTSVWHKGSEPLNTSDPVWKQATSVTPLYRKTEMMIFGRTSLASCSPVPARSHVPGSSWKVLSSRLSAQTWTLGTHIIVTCKPPCRKHTIHLYILNLQAMTAQGEQGENTTGRRKRGRDAACVQSKPKCWDAPSCVWNIVTI